VIFARYGVPRAKWGSLLRNLRRRASKDVPQGFNYMGLVRAAIISIEH